jgi:hypothetical protein
MNTQKCYFATFFEHKNVSNSVENIRESFCDVKVKKDREGTRGRAGFTVLTPRDFFFILSCMKRAHFGI